EVHEAEVPVTEGEVRALFPSVPSDLDLLAAFESDGRFVQRHGRWHSAAALAAEAHSAATTTPVPAAATHGHAQEVVDAEEAVMAASTVTGRAGSERAGSERAGGAGAGSASAGGAGVGGATGAIAQHLGAAAHDTPSLAAGPWAGGSGAGGHGAEDHSRASVFERR